MNQPGLLCYLVTFSTIQPLAMRHHYFQGFAGLCLSLCWISASAQFSEKEFKEHWKPVHKDYLYMHTTEVSNLNYKEFLHDLKRSGKTEAHAAALPDTLVWRDKGTYNEPYIEYYLRHPAYNDYPLVGVTQQQAELYCQWLTEKINASLPEANTPFQKVLVRLPSEKEWEMAARAGNEFAIYPWGTTDLRYPSDDRKWAGQMRANFVRGREDFMGVAGTMNDNSDVTAPVISYWPNPFGLYNMAGNVAEMIAEPGIAKGGAWNCFGADLQIDSRLMYTEPKPFIGFRVLLEVVEFRQPAKKEEFTLTARSIEQLLEYIPSGSFNMGNSDQDVPYLYQVRSRVVSVAGFHCARYETTNKLYNAFLKDLESTAPHLAEKYKSKNENWQLVNAPKHLLNYSWQSQFANYPVVNVSHEAAEAFCQWLTSKYMSFSDRKYREAAFALPTEAEWEFAARGEQDLAPFPWGGPYPYNVKGCHLANYNPHELRYQHRDSLGQVVMAYPDNDTTLSRGIDGGEFLVAVNAYYPNDFGLFNMAGNAREWLSGKYAPQPFYEFAHDLNPNALVDSSATELQTRGGGFTDRLFWIYNGTRDFRVNDELKLHNTDGLPTVGFRFVMRETPLLSEPDAAR
jgi:formylglycine-generating enzyme required for sulfatase activity